MNFLKKKPIYYFVSPTKQAAMHVSSFFAQDEKSAFHIVLPIDDDGNKINLDKLDEEFETNKLLGKEFKIILCLFDSALATWEIRTKFTSKSLAEAKRRVNISNEMMQELVEKWGDNVTFFSFDAAVALQKHYIKFITQESALKSDGKQFVHPYAHHVKQVD